MFYTFYNSPIGKLIILGDVNGIVKIDLFNYNIDSDKTQYANSSIINIYNKKYGIIKENKDLPEFKNTKQWLNDYFKGLQPKQKIKLNLIGSNFQKIVWEQLLKIPYGKTTTYKQIALNVAKILGKTKMSAQAVGGAVGKNPVLIIVPCHRVVGTNGNLTGFACGLDVKKQLLNIEGNNMNDFHMPKKQ